MPPKQLSEQQQAFASAETINNQNEEMQREIAEQIDQMERPVQTAKMPPKQMSDKQLEFATAETLDPQNETIQREIAAQIDQMERPVQTAKMPPKQMSDKQLEFATAETLDPQNEEIQREIARQISIMENDNDLDDDDDMEYEDIDDYDNLDLRNTAEEIIIDDSILDDSQTVDYNADDDDDDDMDYEDIDDYDNLDLRNTAEEIIIDDSIIGEEAVVSQEMPVQSQEQPSHDMAAIEADSDAALNSQDSDFLKVESDEVLVPSEIMMPESGVLTPSEISIPTPKVPMYPYENDSYMDEALEKTASMAIIDAETETEEVLEKNEDWNIGDVILGLYSVTEEIGTGEKGKVYKIYHKQLGINVAVKNIDVISYQVNNMEDALDSWGNINGHPNIVDYYYTRNIKGVPRIFMEYVDGNDLSFLLREGHSGPDSLYKNDSYSSLKKVLDVAIQTSWALSYAHKEDVVHGDIRPNNIIVTSDGTVKISDFGIHRLVGHPVNVYQSPHEDKSGDVWSWGLCLLHMFAGVSYWNNGENAQEALQKYEEQDIPNHIPVMPNEVKELLEKCHFI